MSTLKINKIRSVLVWVLFIICSLSISCEKLVEVDAPYTSVNAENVYSSDETAISVLTGLYANMSQSVGGVGLNSFLCGLSADELSLWGGITNANQRAYYENALSPVNNTGTNFWGSLSVYRCTEAIEGLTKSDVISARIRQQLLGEAKFMRAYNLFLSTNYFGDVPLLLTTDYKVNSLIARTPQNAVYQQIIKDLQEAQGLLSSSYLNGNLQPYAAANTERVRPTSWVATALLARVYLYTGDYANAEKESTKLISNSALFGLLSLNSVFLKNSKESIWQLQPVTTGRNTNDALTFIIPATGPGTNNPAYLSDFLLNSFESGDLRRTNWVGSITPTNPGTITYYFPYKYKVTQTNAPVTEYSTIFRLAEQYLIRSEARTQQQNILGAQSDLNAVRNRAGLGNTQASTQQTLLNAILHERQVELFTEQGHRWFDLKRTKTINDVMGLVTPIKSGRTWQAYQAWYPIPQSDLDKNSSLIQNKGY